MQRWRYEHRTEPLLPREMFHRRVAHNECSFRGHQESPPRNCAGNGKVSSLSTMTQQDAQPGRAEAACRLARRWMARQRSMTRYSVALLGLLVFLTVAPADQSAQIVGLGTYSNFRFTEEHQYGASVQLWREGEAVFGLFSYSQGLIGDTPAAMIEKVSFDSKTGHISFAARLTMGLHGCKVHRNVPSQDVFHFDGVLSKTSLSGTLKHADNLHKELAPTEENIVLKKSDDWVVTQYASRAQWEAGMKDMLRFRGPKW